MARPSWAPLCPDCGTQLRFRFSRVYGPDDRDADYVCPGCGATGTRREPHCAWVRWNPAIQLKKEKRELVLHNSNEIQHD